MKLQYHSFWGKMVLCISLSAVGMLFIVLYSYKSLSSVIEKQIYEKIDAMYLEIEENIKNDIETINEAVRLTGHTTSAQNYLLSDDPSTVIFSSANAMEFWSYVFQEGSICQNVYLYSDNNRYLTYRTGYREVTKHFLDKYGFYEDVSLDKSFFSEIFYISDDGTAALSEPENNQTPYTIYFAPIYSSAIGVFSNQNRIVSAVLCDMTSFTGWLKNQYSSSITSLLIDDRLVSTSGTDFPEELSDVLKKVTREQESIPYQGHNYFTKMLDIPTLNASLIYMVAEEEVVGPLRASRNATLAVLFFVTGITLLLMNLVLRNLTRSINAIVYDTMNLRKQPGITHVRPSKIIELNSLSAAINGMLERMDEAAQRDKENHAKLYEAVLAQNRAELVGYRSQINPHFLFNTLECMRSMAQVYSARPLEEMITSMAAMFRYSLYSAMFVTLKEEIEHVRHYVSVMQMRYPEQFHLGMQISSQAYTYPVVSMMLQPLVENAILHAFPPERQNCHIYIRAFINEADTLILSVTDNGIGLTEEQLVRLRENIVMPEEDIYEEKNSISLQNIFRRMKLTFGEQFEITIHSRKGSYTSVKLQIPRTLSENFQPLL